MRFSRGVWVLFICVILLLVLFIILFPSNPPINQIQPPQETMLLGNPPSMSDSSGQTVAPESVQAKTQTASSTQSTKPLVSNDSQSGPLTVFVTDALGDPISSGIVHIGTGEYHYDNGRVDIPSLEKGTYTMTAAADGYQSATKTVQIPETKEISITLEYACSFEIVVFSSQRMDTPVRARRLLYGRGHR